MPHVENFFEQAGRICATINIARIEMLAAQLAQLRDRQGRLFIIGAGGSAANSSHAVNDFRKLCGIEAYTPVDNVAELTARTNDEGWDTVFAAWLDTSRLNSKDALLILSVGGGDAERNISTNLIKAIDLACERGAMIFGIVGKDSGYTAKWATKPIIIPDVHPPWVTPLSEAFQAVVWHCLVSHPSLQRKPTKW
jgi:D-sedoheptulose 7-phosphate isomerase